MTSRINPLACEESLSSRITECQIVGVCRLLSNGHDWELGYQLDHMEKGCRHKQSMANGEDSEPSNRFGVR